MSQTDTHIARRGRKRIQTAHEAAAVEDTSSNAAAAAGCDCLIGCTLDLVEDVAERLRRLDKDDLRPETGPEGGANRRDAFVDRLREEVRRHKEDTPCVCGRIKQ